MKQSGRLKTGLIIPKTFWLNTLLCGYILGDYIHAYRMVSELGEIGCKTQYWFTLGMVSISVLSFIFINKLLIISRKIQINRIPIGFICLFIFISNNLQNNMRRFYK